MPGKIKEDKNILLFTIVVICLFIILATRLFAMQVIDNESYTTLSEKNTIRVISVPASRGNIYDKDMTELAVSKPVFAVSVAASEISDEREQVAEILAPILNDPEVTVESIVETLEANYSNYQPVVLKRYPYEEGLAIISSIEERRADLPGVTIEEEPMRYYPLGSAAGHILGTVGMINEDELEDLEDLGYTRNDWIGKSGVEKTMERFAVDGKDIGLRGQDGMKQVEVNANGRTVRDLSTKEPVSGNSLVLTVDMDVQEVMEQSLANTVAQISSTTNSKCKAAAAVLIDIKTGSVIAMASFPTMDPNEFASGLSTERAKYYYDETLKPTFNRAVSGAYPPGSTFKTATATAILASGLVDPNATVSCNSSVWGVGDLASCPSAHGTVNLKEALAVSCNVYFQKMGAVIGIDNLDTFCGQLGFGQKTGIELPAESAGLLPSPEWKADRFEGKEGIWKTYDTYYMSMGQGYNNDTILQLANSVATIANGGNRMQVHLVDKVLDSDGETLYQTEPSVLNSLEISDSSLQLVRDGMRAVCQPGGTSYNLFKDFPIKVAAKTGTAQTGLTGDNKNKDYHGCFVAFAPYDDPQVAFACIIEYGYHGGSSGGVVCKDVFAEYFGLNEEPESNDLPNAAE